MIDPWSAVQLSLIVGAFSVALGLPIAVAFGWVLARLQFRGKTLLTLVLLAPLALPPVVTGYLLLDVFGRTSRVGAWLEALGLPLSFSLAGAILAAMVVGLPLYVLSARTAFEAVDPRLDEVSATLGRRPFHTFFHVTLPLAAPGIAAGAILCFARALGEFGATVVLAGNMEGQTRTIPLAIYTLLESAEGDREIRMLILTSIGLSFAALIGYEWLLRTHKRKLEWHR